MRRLGGPFGSLAFAQGRLTAEPPAEIPNAKRRDLFRDGVTKKMAPQVGLEPTTLRLTAGCSAIELLRSGQTGFSGRSRESRMICHFDDSMPPGDSQSGRTPTAGAPPHHHAHNQSRACWGSRQLCHRDHGQATGLFPLQLYNDNVNWPVSILCFGPLNAGREELFEKLDVTFHRGKSRQSGTWPPGHSMLAKGSIAWDHLE